MNDTRIGNDTGSLRFLVVDDDEAFIECVVEAVSGLGHDVVGRAFDGDSGVRIFAEKNDAVDVVIMDMVMPGKNGILAAMEMKRINPLKKIILMSCDERNRKLASALDDVSFIHKPFGNDAIHSIITE